MDQQIIVSLTSWPKRIDLVAPVIFSLNKQNISRELYKIILVLARPEFPNLYHDLPKPLQYMIYHKMVDVIWYDENIYSHKKLMPTLAMYPNNPILVCDDDILRPANWISAFMNDYIAHPTDVIVGGCAFDIGYDKFGFNPVMRPGFDTPDSAGKIVKGRRPANGYGGVLYPPHTFTDTRFFDKKLMLELSKYSDESWQFCFNVIENRRLRYCSTYIPHFLYLQANSYDNSMSKMRNDTKVITDYRTIYNRLIQAFPEFNTNLINYI